MDVLELRRRVGDLRQLASVRRITLDDGPEQGLRALAFSTGGGLDFWAMSDRSLDIGTLSWQGVPLAWQAPCGLVHPKFVDRDGEGGRGFDRLFSGFLVTCGLDHIRQPRDGQPLHGRFPATPGCLLGYGEDWDRPDPLLFCAAEMIQARLGGEALRLRRRIEAPIGGAALVIDDDVENIGAQPWPLALLYHFNLGWPAIASGTVVDCGGSPILGPLVLPDTIGSAVPETRPVGRSAICEVRTPTGTGQELTIRFAWDGDALPYLQSLANMAPRIALLAIEPCTSERLEAGTSGPGPTLEPGERRRFRIEISIRGRAPEYISAGGV
jgi:hypothetical protein